MVQLLECKSCDAAKSDSPQAWMQHIATYHIIPTEWPSERAKRLTGSDALRPYSTVADSKKKRKKDSIARPLNSFMIFSQYIRRNVLEVFKEHANADMSKQLGKLWGSLDDHFKNQYHEEAERMARLHDLEFPDYKYQPRKGKRNDNLISNPINNSTDIYKQSINTSIHKNLIQHHQISQQINSPISVVTNTIPLIKSKSFEPKDTLPKHILCSPISSTQNKNNTNTTAFPKQARISYISGSSDSAYSSEIGSCSSSSVPSPAIGDFLIQSPMKHYIDERGSQLHHWTNVDGRRFFQTPRQASSSSMPEYCNGATTPNGSEMKTCRKRFYSGTNDENFQKIPCIAEADEGTSLELDVVDQNGNKMKLRIENGSKEILKNLLLNEKDSFMQRVNHISEPIYVQQQNNGNNVETNCHFVSEQENNYVEYIVPIGATQQDVLSQLNSKSTIQISDNRANHHQQPTAIFAYIPEQNFNQNSTSNSTGNIINQQIPMQFIQNNQFENGQIIMINEEFLRANQDLNNNTSHSIMSSSGLINATNIQQYQIACGKTLEELTLEAALPSDLAALDTASLYRIN